MVVPCLQELGDKILASRSPEGVLDPLPAIQQYALGRQPYMLVVWLKVHKIENFFGSEFEFYTISLLVMLKY